MLLVSIYYSRMLKTISSENNSLILYFAALPDVVNDSSGGDPVNDTLWNNSGSNSVVIECSTKSNTWQPNVHPFAHRTQQRYTNKTTTNSRTKKSPQQNNNLNNSTGVVVQVNNNNNNQCSSYARYGNTGCGISREGY